MFSPFGIEILITELVLTCAIEYYLLYPTLPPLPLTQMTLSDLTPTEYQKQEIINIHKIF